MIRREFIVTWPGLRRLCPAAGARRGTLSQPAGARVVVPFTAGGGTDVVARAIAMGLSKLMAESFFVDNKPGASTLIGSELVAKAAPDGYTLQVASVPPATNPWMMK